MKFLLYPLLVAALTGCASGPIAKASLDAEVRRLCAIDGGVKVYETVGLSAQEFDQHGQVRIPAKQAAKPGDGYYYRWTQDYSRRGNPELWRNTFEIVRAADSRVLGTAVSYVRVGGDAPGPWHESSFICPDDAGLNDLKRQVFLKAD